MAPLKARLQRFRFAIIVLLFAGLGLNALAPAGYMIAPSATGWPVIVMCPQTHPLARLMALAARDNGSATTTSVDHAAMGHGDDDSNPLAAQHNEDCAFSLALHLATGPIDSELLAALIAFILLLGLIAASRIVIRPSRYLRPPLRGPPVRI